MTGTASAVADVSWLVWTVVWPLVAAVIILVRGRTLAPLIGLLGGLGAAVAVLGLTWQVWRLGPQRYQVGGWGAPLGIELYADGMSVSMLLMTTVVGVLVSGYAVAYFADEPHAPNGTAPRAVEDDHGRERAYFWPLWLSLWAALNALFVSADIFNLYVTLELITLASVALVALAGSRLALTAALRYLIAAILGSLLYLLAVALFYWAYGTLDVVSLGRAMTPGTLSSVAIALMTLGLMLKSALFPLHFWLPSAHANAPAPVSAVLSALVVKASYYLLLRLWFDAFRGVLPADAGVALGVLGGGAIVWGSIQALFAQRLKLLVAYSTVAQLGYLFLVFPLAPAGERLTAWYAAGLFAASHACAKAAMFLAAGSVLKAAGHDRIADLGAVAPRLASTFFIIGLAGVSIMGLPPSGAFVAKWMLIDAAIATRHWWLAGIIIAGGLLAAGYMFRVLAAVFTTAPVAGVFLVPRGMNATALTLAVVGLVLGFLAAPMMDLLQIGAPSPFGAGRDPLP
jgi:multicomponent Na+:H+ antiporter subunit D